MATIAETLQLALRHHQAGRLSAAEAIYRQILEANPTHADANHLLGVLEYQSGRNEVAIPHLRRAIAVNAGVAAFHSNLGNALASQGMRFARAHVNIAICQPSRSVMATGRFPHRNGAEGFGPIRDDVPVITDVLRAAGYRCAILGKVEHLEPV